MGHGPTLIPDFTILLQFVIFMSAYLVMKYLVFDPYVKLIELRKSKTEGLKVQAKQSKEKAVQLEEDYETLMKTERKKISVWLEEQRREVLDEERNIIHQARGQVAKSLEETGRKIDADLENSRKQLLPHISEFASEIAGKLLGRKVSISASSRASERAEQTAT